jgi:NAD(P) transhydrogenase subunit alpha
MIIAVPKEHGSGETRVALTPNAIAPLLRNDHSIIIEAGAGSAANFSDDDYTKAGATVVSDSKELYAKAEVIFRITPPLEKSDLGLLTEKHVLISFLNPFNHPELVKTLSTKKVTTFAMDLVPRISRAQSMDALSSMASIAGYKMVLEATNHLAKFFPLMMTAAGTIPPAAVLVLGAGVAGLQAIATAKRLGAKVEAFDPRPVVKEQVESLGGTFIAMAEVEDAETTSGYAKEQSDDFLRREKDTIGERLPKIDVVITTAQIFGKPAPVLITKAMLEKMPKGSVVIDLVSQNGGNCEVSEPGKVIEYKGVKVVAVSNLPAQMATHASQMYAKNISTLFNNIFPKDGEALDFEDEINLQSCVTHAGELKSPWLKERFEK